MNLEQQLNEALGTQQFYHGSPQPLEVGQIMKFSHDIRQANLRSADRHSASLLKLEGFIEEIRTKEYPDLPSRMNAIYLMDTPGFGIYKYVVTPLGKVYGPFNYDLITKLLSPASNLADFGIKSIYQEELPQSQTSQIYHDKTQGISQFAKWHIDEKNVFSTLSYLRKRIREYWGGICSKNSKKEYMTIDPIRIDNLITK